MRAIPSQLWQGRDGPVQLENMAIELSCVPVLSWLQGVGFRCGGDLNWNGAGLASLKRLVQSERGCFQTCRRAMKAVSGLAKKEKRKRRRTQRLNQWMSA